MSATPIVPNIQILDICPPEAILARRQFLLDELSAAVKTLKRSILDVGRILTDLREVTPRGEWERVLENICADFDISRSSAHNYMQAHEQIKSLPVEVVTACREGKFRLDSKPKLDAIVKAFVENPEATPAKIVKLARENPIVRMEDSTPKPDDPQQKSPPVAVVEPAAIEPDDDDDVESALRDMQDADKSNPAVAALLAEAVANPPAESAPKPTQPKEKGESQFKKTLREWNEAQEAITNAGVQRSQLLRSSPASDVEVTLGRYDLHLFGVS